MSTKASTTRVRRTFWVPAAASIACAVLAAVLLHPGGAALISADPVPFRISGDVSGLVPGVPADVPLTLENPNASPIRVTSVRAAIAPNSVAYSGRAHS